MVIERAFVLFVGHCQEFGEADYSIERCAYLVAHVGKEGRFQQVGPLSLCLGLFQFVECSVELRNLLRVGKQVAVPVLHCQQVFADVPHTVFTAKIGVIVILIATELNGAFVVVAQLLHHVIVRYEILVVMPHNIVAHHVVQRAELVVGLHETHFVVDINQIENARNVVDKCLQHSVCALVAVNHGVPLGVVAGKAGVHLNAAMVVVLEGHKVNLHVADMPICPWRAECAHKYSLFKIFAAFQPLHKFLH